MTQVISYNAPSYRPYSPGFRPWVSILQRHLPSDVSMVMPKGAPLAPAATAGLGELGAMPGALGVVLGLGAVAILVAGAAWLGMGYYVGKKMGSKHGWFWGGFGGPIGLAALGMWREKKGHGGASAVPNRRRRHRRGRK